jgi:undecaprenyl-diphosphatase
VSLVEAILLGLIQGLTEFLPISSSAHLRILGEFLPSAADPGAAFTAIIQIGTELAVLLYFRRDIARIASAWWEAAVLRRGGWRVLRRSGDPGLGREKAADARMGWLIIVGSIPIVVLGLAFQDVIETRLRDLHLTAAALMLFALILGWADGRSKRSKRLADLDTRDGLLFGLAQALALIPGVSRSGGTITAGLLMGYTREAAARYSFLLAMPAVFGSGLFELGKSLGHPGAVPGWGATIVAALVAFVVGYVVIIGFLKIISTYSYRPFVYYRIGLGLLVALLLETGALAPF